jgi:hypothetical protein
MSFPEEVIAEFRRKKGLRIRAGAGSHRFIGIWFVLVRDRVFVRSWSVKPDGWYRTFLTDSGGTVKIANYEIGIRAVRTRDKRLRDEIDQAYLDKYNSAGEIRYARDLASVASRAATLELRPLPAR